jgi:HEPN domain-containing protein
VKRQDLQALSQAKIDDAVLLSQSGRWGNAYYLAGYAVELGLKACISRQISADTIPDIAILKGVLTHEFDKLLGLAGLKDELRTEQKQSVDFSVNWGIASEWTPDDRYRAKTAIEAQYLIEAVADGKDGVLQWIRRYW